MAGKFDLYQLIFPNGPTHLAAPLKTSDDFHHLRILNAIAHELNGEVKLQSILQATLRQTVELLGLRTGWIWLVSPGSRSVYLAASHHLPPALAQHPERLSGWCYCIDKYLADHLEEAVNISEITCSRLKDLTEGTDGLRYHASVPLRTGNRQIGIMNVVSQQSQELDSVQLQLLYTIGDLLSMAVERTRLYENSRRIGADEERKRLSDSLRERLMPGLDALQTKSQAMQAWLELGNTEKLGDAIRQTQQLLAEMAAATGRTLSDLGEALPVERESAPIQYPTVPLTERELMGPPSGTTMFIRNIRWRTIKRFFRRNRAAPKCPRRAGRSPQRSLPNLLCGAFSLPPCCYTPEFPV